MFLFHSCAAPNFRAGFVYFPICQGAISGQGPFFSQGRAVAFPPPTPPPRQDPAAPRELHQQLGPC